MFIILIIDFINRWIRAFFGTCVYMRDRSEINVLANFMSLECKTLPYLHVRMRGLDGVNVFDGKHSSVLPGPHLVEIILPSIRHVGQLAKQDSHHYLKKWPGSYSWLRSRHGNQAVLLGQQTAVANLPEILAIFSPIGLEVNEREEVVEKLDDEMSSLDEGVTNTKYSWKVESL